MDTAHFEGLVGHINLGVSLPWESWPLGKSLAPRCRKKCLPRRHAGIADEARRQENRPESLTRTPAQKKASPFPLPKKANPPPKKKREQEVQRTLVGVLGLGRAFLEPGAWTPVPGRRVNALHAELLSDHTKVAEPTPLEARYVLVYMHMFVHVFVAIYGMN